jgi:hypothetical protein
LQLEMRDAKCERPPTAARCPRSQAIEGAPAPAHSNWGCCAPPVYRLNDSLVVSIKCRVLAGKCRNSFAAIALEAGHWRSINVGGGPSETEQRVLCSAGGSNANSVKLFPAGGRRAESGRAELSSM